MGRTFPPDAESPACCGVCAVTERRRALVTGASSGIGAAYARQLAAENVDLLLVARRQEKLEALAGELSGRSGVTVQVRSVDLADPEALAALVDEVAAGAPFDLLINNAGFGTRPHFAASDIERQVQMVRVHNEAALRLCRAALPAMVDAGRGAIINVASISAYLPNPGTATYSATKAFLVAFSEGLAREVGAQGVQVQALCPGFTSSEFHDTPEYEGFRRSQIPAFMWQTSEEVVDISLKALQKNRVIVVPGWPNRLLVTAARLGLAAPILRVYGLIRSR